MHFQFDHLCSVTTYDIFAAVLQYITEYLFHETAWPILFWSPKNDVTGLVKFQIEYWPPGGSLNWVTHGEVQ